MRSFWKVVFLIWCIILICFLFIVVFICMMLFWSFVCLNYVVIFWSRWRFLWLMLLSWFVFSVLEDFVLVFVRLRMCLRVLWFFFILWKSRFNGGWCRWFLLCCMMWLCCVLDFCCILCILRRWRIWLGSCMRIILSIVNYNVYVCWGLVVLYCFYMRWGGCWWELKIFFIFGMVVICIMICI